MPELLEVARVDDVPVGSVKVVEVRGQRIALCNYEGVIYAIDDVCTHDRGPLGQGVLTGKNIECPRHGALFDVTDGRAVRLPAVRPVKTYRVHMRDGAVLVEVPVP